MEEFTSIESAYNWVIRLGEKHEVNPLAFAIIYIGSKTLFLFSIGWFIRNVRVKRAIFLPVIAIGFFFILPYVYLIIEGENFHWWVYTAIGAWVFLSGWGAFSKVKRKVTAKKMK